MGGSAATDGDLPSFSGKDPAMTTPTRAAHVRSLVAALATPMQTAARALWHQPRGRETGPTSNPRTRLVGVAAMAAAGLTAMSLMGAPAQATGSQLDIARGVVTYNGSPIAGVTVHAYLWPSGRTLVGQARG